ncbi:hypothetical protein BY996DRAFT_4463324 [Phakopsora pachyrhizi]|nr:hypothetical protein BY996DRAFT_4463324 [Phakopsora pachyrhizi]
MERFKVDLRQALEWDDSKSYLYTIQLIDDHRSRENGEDDQEDHFEASYMEVEPRKLRYGHSINLWPDRIKEIFKSCH